MTTKVDKALSEQVADRRHFLRHALKIGGAAALLMTAANRDVLASSLSLSSHDLEEARKARLAKSSARPAGSTEVSAVSYNGCDCSGCSGCTSSCTGCNGCSSCSGCSGCSGTSK